MTFSIAGVVSETRLCEKCEYVLERCHVDMDNLKNSELLPFVETARYAIIYQKERKKLRPKIILSKYKMDFQEEP